MTSLRIATAGWTIPRTSAEHFPAEGTTLQRYAARLPAAEINSCFYRSHRASTWERWREATPPDFRFAVKVPKAITHERRLADCEPLLDSFLAEARLLGEKLGPLLVQLPPSAAFEAATAERFFAALRQRFEGPVACEPRHPTWFEAEADRLLRQVRAARVAADPARVPAAAEPGGFEGLAYWRWHGSPHMYRSPYGEARLRPLAQAILAHPAAERWCVFDNTTSGAAAADALILQALT